MHVAIPVALGLLAIPTLAYPDSVYEREILAELDARDFYEEDLYARDLYDNLGSHDLYARDTYDGLDSHGFYARELGHRGLHARFEHEPVHIAIPIESPPKLPSGLRNRPPPSQNKPLPSIPKERHSTTPEQHHPATPEQPHPPPPGQSHTLTPEQPHPQNHDYPPAPHPMALNPGSGSTHQDAPTGSGNPKKSWWKTLQPAVSLMAAGGGIGGMIHGASVHSAGVGVPAAIATVGGALAGVQSFLDHGKRGLSQREAEMEETLFHLERRAFGEKWAMVANLVRRDL